MNPVYEKLVESLKPRGGDVALRIGCGLCVSTCPSGAVTLVLREQPPVPPLIRAKLGAALSGPSEQT